MFHRVIHAPKFIPQVIDSAKRVAPGHPGTRKTHHFLRLLPFGGLVTVYRAIRTGGFMRPVRTFLQPALGVPHQV